MSRATATTGASSARWSLSRPSGAGRRFPERGSRRLPPTGKRRRPSRRPSPRASSLNERGVSTLRFSFAFFPIFMYDASTNLNTIICHKIDLSRYKTRKLERYISLQKTRKKSSENSASKSMTKSSASELSLVKSNFHSNE